MPQAHRRAHSDLRAHATQPPANAVKMRELAPNFLGYLPSLSRFGPITIPSSMLPWPEPNRHSYLGLAILKSAPSYQSSPAKGSLTQLRRINPLLAA